MSKSDISNLPYRKNAGAIILDDDKNFLIVIKPDMTSWQFVQGGVEKGESFEEALKRELKEEVGIEKFSIIGVADYKNQYDWPERLQMENHFKGQIQTIFLVKVDRGTKIVLEKKELADYKWVKSNEIDNFLEYENLIYSLNEIRKQFPDIFN